MREETPVTSTETATSELAAFKETVRSTAEEYLKAGYGNREAWNRMLVHVGLQPMSAQQIVVKATVSAPVVKPVEVPEGFTPEQWVNRNGGAKGLLTVHDLQPHFNDAEAEYEVVETTPGTEGVEPKPDASTEDLARYKRLVRREGIELQHEFDWCESGTSDVFERVGLPRIGEVQVLVDVTTVQRIRLTTSAMDEEEAAELLAAGELNGLVRGSINRNQRLVSIVPADMSRHFVGDVDPTGYGSRANRASTVRDLECCAAHDPQSGYYCTWSLTDGAHEGDHIAAGYGEVYAVWPQA